MGTTVKQHSHGRSQVLPQLSSQPGSLLFLPALIPRIILSMVITRGIARALYPRRAHSSFHSTDVYYYTVY